MSINTPEDINPVTQAALDQEAAVDELANNIATKRGIPLSVADADARAQLGIPVAPDSLAGEDEWVPTVPLAVPKAEKPKARTAAQRLHDRRLEWQKRVDELPASDAAAEAGSAEAVADATAPPATAENTAATVAKFRREHIAGKILDIMNDPTLSSREREAKLENIRYRGV